MRTFRFFSRLLRHEQTGQSLLEVIIALALMAMLFSASFLAISRQLIELSTGTESIRVMLLAKEGLEATRLIRDASWSNLTNGSHGLVSENGQWRFQGTSDAQGAFTRTITVSEQATNERLVRSEVRWSVAGQTRQAHLSTVLSNWRNTVPALLTGNWQNPQTLSTLDLGPGNEATALAVRSGIVYLTARSGSANKPDLFIIDATTPSAPLMRGSLDTGEGLNAIALSGPYAFVLQRGSDSGAQVHVVDINNPSTPTLVRSFSLGQSAEQEAISIAIAGSSAYIGTKISDDQPEFFVVDITDPLNPTVRGSLEVGADVNRIAVHNNRVMLATSKNTAELVIVDARVITAPIQTNSYNAAGTLDALGLFINPQDNRAYLTRESGSASSPDVVILNLTNPDIPSLLGTHTLGANVNAVFAADALAFFATSASNEEFKILEVLDPATPNPYGGLNFPQIGVDLGFEDNIIYAAVRSNDALRIVTSQ